MAKARTMHLYAKCPPFMWDEFYLTASHLQNKTTTQSLQGTTPWEKWYERKPDYSYMREISCRAFVLIQPMKKNPKVLERSLKCILIGYDKDSKTYHCYHCETNRVISSYHVCFLKSHEGHQPHEINLPEFTTELATLDSIVQSATSTPVFFDKEEEEYLPLQNPTEDIPIPHEPIIEPAVPHHSCCIAEKPLDPKPS